MRTGLRGGDLSAKRLVEVSNPVIDSLPFHQQRRVSCGEPRAALFRLQIERQRARLSPPPSQSPSLYKHHYGSLTTCNTAWQPNRYYSTNSNTRACFTTPHSVTLTGKFIYSKVSEYTTNCTQQIYVEVVSTYRASNLAFLRAALKCFSVCFATSRGL